MHLGRTAVRQAMAWGAFVGIAIGAHSPAHAAVGPGLQPEAGTATITLTIQDAPFQSTGNAVVPFGLANGLPFSSVFSQGTSSISGTTALKWGSDSTGNELLQVPLSSQLVTTFPGDFVDLHIAYQLTWSAFGGSFAHVTPYVYRVVGNVQGNAQNTQFAHFEAVANYSDSLGAIAPGTGVDLTFDTAAIGPFDSGNLAQSVFVPGLPVHDVLTVSGFFDWRADPATVGLAAPTTPEPRSAISLLLGATMLAGLKIRQRLRPCH